MIWVFEEWKLLVFLEMFHKLVANKLIDGGGCWGPCILVAIVGLDMVGGVVVCSNDSSYLVSEVAQCSGKHKGFLYQPHLVLPSTCLMSSASLFGLFGQSNSLEICAFWGDGISWPCWGRWGRDEEGQLLDHSAPSMLLVFSCQRWVRAESGTPGPAWYYLGGKSLF